MPQIRATRYVGWLLRANRLTSEDKILRSGREFARLFRRDGEQPLSPSHVTRWETGRLPANHGVIRRYEQLLGLEAESLVTINDALVRLEGSPTTRHFEVPDDAHAGKASFHELLERACTPGAMNGTAWGRLTEHIAMQPGLVLHPPRLWRTLTEQLLTELVFANYNEWLQRQEAMSRLLEHPDACGHAIAACIALVDDRMSPAVIEPLSLLNVTAHPVANQYVLRQIEQPDHDRTLHGALLAAINKVTHGHFAESQWARLDTRVTDYLRDQSVDQTLVPLLSEVRRRFDGLRGHFPVQAVSGQAEPDAPAATGRRPSQRILALVQTRVADEAIEVDDGLAALVDDILFHGDPDRRMIVGLLLAATPFKTAVAKAILEEFTKSLRHRSNAMPLATLRTLTNIGVDLHRPLIRDILTQRGPGEPLRHAAAWATPHCPGRFTETEWRTILSRQAEQQPAERSGNEAILQGITYGIGTDGHDRLLAEIRDNAVMPTSARSMASWLLTQPADLARR